MMEPESETSRFFNPTTGEETRRGALLQRLLALGESMPTLSSQDARLLERVEGTWGGKRQPVDFRRWADWDLGPLLAAARIDLERHRGSYGIALAMGLLQGNSTTWQRKAYRAARSLVRELEAEVQERIDVHQEAVRDLKKALRIKKPSRRTP